VLPVIVSSFKIWNEATVGGNLCTSLPAGPVILLTAALEGVCTLWPRSGEPRQVSVVDFVTPLSNADSGRLVDGPSAEFQWTKRDLGRRIPDSGRDGRLR
jgi:hypothetical protein